jgi:hypothetical protein
MVGKTDDGHVATGTFYGNRTTQEGRRSPCADRALARRSMQGTLHHRSGAQAAGCRWKIIRSFTMKSGCRSCALAVASSSALGINHRKTTHTSTSRSAMPVRSFAPTVLRYSASIRAWAQTKPIRRIVLTVSLFSKRRSSFWAAVRSLLPLPVALEASPAARQLSLPPLPMLPRDCDRA